jgi:hypothetical protein
MKNILKLTTLHRRQKVKPSKEEPTCKCEVKACNGEPTKQPLTAVCERMIKNT